MAANERKSCPPLRRAGLFLIAGCLIAVAGCATGPGKNAGPAFVFYPPLPAPPRIQFLTSYSDEKDLGFEVSKFSSFVTGAQPPSQPIFKPYGVALAGDQLFICDTGAQGLDILDLAQKTMRRFTPRGAGKMGTPINVVVDKDGTRYVSDTGRGRVMIYGKDDSFLGTLDEDNSVRPNGLALSAERVFVTDVNGHTVRVHDKATRKLLYTIPRDPSAEDDSSPAKLFVPACVALDQLGRVYVTDMSACRVQIYDQDGRYRHTLGGLGDMPGRFARPKGVAVDREGRIYVVDAAAQVCQIFDAEGKLLVFFGEPDVSPVSLNLPAAVIVDYDHVGSFKKFVAPGFVIEHLVIITNQYGDRKVNVYGLGHKK